MSTTTISFKTPGPTNGGFSVPEGSNIPPMRPRTGKRATNKKLAALLVEALDDLSASSCSFWACKGPSRPKPMCTCRKCYAMRQISTVYASLLAKETS